MDKDQIKRFQDTAHKLECDEDEGHFNETLKRVVKSDKKDKEAAS